MKPFDWPEEDVRYTGLLSAVHDSDSPHEFSTLISIPYPVFSYFPRFPFETRQKEVAAMTSKERSRLKLSLRRVIQKATPDLSALRAPPAPLVFPTLRPPTRRANRLAQAERDRKAGRTPLQVPQDVLELEEWEEKEYQDEMAERNKCRCLSHLLSYGTSDYEWIPWYSRRYAWTHVYEKATGYACQERLELLGPLEAEDNYWLIYRKPDSISLKDWIRAYAWTRTLDPKDAERNKRRMNRDDAERSRRRSILTEEELAQIMARDGVAP